MNVSKWQRLQINTLLHTVSVIIIIIFISRLPERHKPIELATIKQQKQQKLEFGMYPQSMPTEWTHARTVRPWQSVRLKKL